MKFLPKIFFLTCTILLILFYPINSNAQPETGIIIGIVKDSKNNALANVNIFISGSAIGTVSTKEGYYGIKKLLPGKYVIKFLHIGYKLKIEKDVLVRSNQITRLDVNLTPEAILFREIVVTPGNYLISQSQTAKQQSIQKKRITSLPATLDDIYRVLQIMPGVASSNDFSAHFHVRGGKQNENLILLDGVEIFDPYHLKNIGGAIGVMNLDLIENLSILTGGFPAKYGDKLSSVVVLKSREGNRQKPGGSFGIGGTGVKIVAEGPIPSGNWLLSFRKSFLKEAVEFVNPTSYTFSPSFYDFQSKIVVKPNKNNRFITNILYSKDHSFLEKWHNDSNLFSDYGNGYYSLMWKSFINPVIYSELILSSGNNFWNNRIGSKKEEKLNLAENAAKWDLNFHLRDHYELETGVTYKKIGYEYTLKTDSLSTEQTNLEDILDSYYGDKTIHSHSYKVAAYLQNKIKICEPIVANFGVRYDYFAYNTDRQVSPRIGFVYKVTDRTILRAAWGHYFQAPVYTELISRQGSEINPKAEKAVHNILGIEHYFNKNFSIRMEGYFKDYTRMIGHYVELRELPEKPIIHYGNPFKGYAKGIELFINGQLSPKVTIWMAYSYSMTRIETSIINWENRTVSNELIPRITDQPHNLSFYLEYKLPRNWKFNLKWRYLSGVPYTPRHTIWDASGNPEWKSERIYSSRYPAYHRMDLRIGKNFGFSNFNLFMFLEIKNVYNRKNVLLYSYKIENNKHEKKVYYTLPFLPSIEFNIVF